MYYNRYRKRLTEGELLLKRRKHRIPRLQLIDWQDCFLPVAATVVLIACAWVLIAHGHNLFAVLLAPTDSAEKLYAFVTWTWVALTATLWLVVYFTYRQNLAIHRRVYANYRR